ncbi:restriction endonuclease subunit S [Tsukamurella paurometabola]|uniref:Type I restriction modification DNA specificity domain n=1 Tax=Tsukamurella paurometabola TaxID=2061 RepID=A0A3P8K4M4_TSUPA|nr:restriction endonuclease subunit S [Tsukamurella paurometabola]UEA83205.1 restriction endonuclease subunit S [Tsukamurella paurometabola]VDR40299.1 Type I restriction modification DNA specificity domain [Tsukamurella paurometabola]
MSKLGDVLRFAGVPERISSPAEETFVTVKMNCGGAVERPIKVGKIPAPFTGYRVSPGQFIYSRIDARNGAFAVIPDVLDGAVVSKDFPPFDIRRNRIDPAYLQHFFRSGVLQRRIRAASRGATNRQRIGEEEFLEFPIALPKLDEQRRIAAILDRADQLCGASKTAVDLHDESVTQTYRAMFGGLKKRIPIGEFARVASGSTPRRDDPRNFGGGIPWVKTGEVSGIIKSTEEAVSRRGLEAARLEVYPPGSVVIAMYGQGATRGRSAILGIPATTNQACAVILPNDEFDPVFLQAQLSARYDELRGGAEGGNQPNLSGARIKSFEVCLPPIGEQRKFATIVRSIGLSRSQAQERSQLLVELQNALQARAFRGEL